MILGVPSAAKRTLLGFSRGGRRPDHGLGDAVRQRFDQLGCPPCRPGRALELPVQAAPREILQLEEWQAIGLADVVDLHDMRVWSWAMAWASARNRAADGAGMAAAQDHL